MNLQQIITRSYEEQFGGRSLPPHMWRAAQRISLCRTPALGGHVQACPEGHVERRWFHSCRHRSCPVCNHTATEHWLDRQKARILNCERGILGTVYSIDTRFSLDKLCPWHG